MVRAILLRTSPIKRLRPLELKFKTRNKTEPKEDINYENKCTKERDIEHERPRRAAVDTGILIRRMQGQEEHLERWNMLLITL